MSLRLITSVLEHPSDVLSIDQFAAPHCSLYSSAPILGGCCVLSRAQDLQGLPGKWPMTNEKAGLFDTQERSPFVLEQQCAGQKIIRVEMLE